MPSLAPVSKPTVYPTEAKKPEMCKFKYTKKAGEKLDVPPGCALISNEKIETMPAGSSTSALYICAAHSVTLTTEDLGGYGLRASISQIVPGMSTGVTYYFKDHLSGKGEKFTSGFHPDLTNLKKGGENDNDNVKSLLFETEFVGAIQLPSVC